MKFKYYIKYLFKTNRKCVKLLQGKEYNCINNKDLENIERYTINYRQEKL